MKDTKDFSWGDSDIPTSSKLGKIVPIPLSASDATIEVMSPPPEEGDEEETVLDVVKRRLASTLSHKLHEE